MPDNVIPFPSMRPRVAEFFAGVGLARMGLERAGCSVTWANDIERFKHAMYMGQFSEPNHEFVLGDICELHGRDVPDVDIAWSSFPCTDLSLAGNRAGLLGQSSSTFYQFTRVLEEMGNRRPKVVALENVTALANSHGGEDLAAAVRELNRLGYSVDVLSIDARRFVPQSRPRLFIVGAMHAPEDNPTPNSELRPDWLQSVFGDGLLITHRASIPNPPAPLTTGLGDFVEELEPDDTRWWDESRTQKFLDSLSNVQAMRLNQLRSEDGVAYRTAYRRTRSGVPTWEIRADDISGCLRTARGGSSKQAVVRAGKNGVQVRWMTPLEYARLMGAGDYNLDGLRDSHILFGFGDAVCVNAVEWLSTNYLLPLLHGQLGLNNIEKETDGQPWSSVL